MPGDVIYSEVDGRSDMELFDQYLALKYDVFVSEQGLEWLPHCDETGRALPDSFDDASHFVLATGQDAGTVGVVRGTVAHSVHELHRFELYRAFFDALPVRLPKGTVGTINALAIRPPFRYGERSADGEAGAPGPMISDHLMHRIISWLRNQGVQLIVLSSMVKSSSDLMQRLGFSRVSRSYLLPGFRRHGERSFEIVNHALCLDPQGFGANDTAECSLIPRTRMIGLLRRHLGQLEHELEWASGCHDRVQVL